MLKTSEICLLSHPHHSHLLTITFWTAQLSQNSVLSVFQQVNDSTLVFHLSKQKNWTLLLRTTGPACPAKTSSTLTLFTTAPSPVHLRIAPASHARNADVWDWKLSHGWYIIHFLLELSGPVRHLRQTFDRLRVEISRCCRRPKPPFEFSSFTVPVSALRPVSLCFSPHLHH